MRIRPIYNILLHFLIVFVIQFDALASSLPGDFSCYIQGHKIVDSLPVCDEQSELSIESNCPVTKKYCVGIIRFKDGSVYNGEISYGRPNGKGFMKWLDGSYYIGSFFKGERCGNGEFHFRNGNRYEGDWSNNEMNGYGIFIWTNGTEYIGHFKDGVMHGTGSVVLSNKESYFGEWTNNLPNGEGNFTLNNGSSYTGSVKNGLRHGRGAIAWENGDTILGNWSVGMFDGEVKFQYHNGDQLHTEWENGQIAGVATYLSNDGQHIEGNFQEIEDELLFGQLDETFASNLQFTYYSIGLEYGNLYQIEKATEYLQMAYSIDTEENRLHETIAQSLSQLKERQKSGWAKLNKKED